MGVPVPIRSIGVLFKYNGKSFWFTHPFVRFGMLVFRRRGLFELIVNGLSQICVTLFGLVFNHE